MNAAFAILLMFFMLFIVSIVLPIFLFLAVIWLRNTEIGFAAFLKMVFEEWRDSWKEGF